MTAATAAMTASRTKKWAWPKRLHKAPTRPAARLPVKIARNQEATVVAPRRGGASRANRPRPVGRM